jgi:hypothetical protein
VTIIVQRALSGVVPQAVPENDSLVVPVDSPYNPAGLSNETDRLLKLNSRLPAAAADVDTSQAHKATPAAAATALLKRCAPIRRDDSKPVSNEESIGV